MTYGQAQAYLYGLRNRGAKYGIERMRSFANALGHPERQYPVIHVAGTNGKGSTCAMLESILRAGGYHTGLFTSPHLVFLGERIQYDRKILSSQELVDYVKELRPLAEALSGDDPSWHPTFFEFMTGMAFLHFARRKVDAAVIEVGLGGRLDSTNILEPQLTVITSVALDHIDILGNTQGAIAREKAGILKPGCPVVIGLLEPEAEKEVRARAAVLNCPVYSVRERFGKTVESYPQSGMEGAYQRVNAAIATLCIEVLRQGKVLVPDDTAVAEGLRTVQWAGRWQRVPLDRGRLLVLDATHNEEGARVLASNLEKLCQETGKRPIILAGVLGEFRAQSLIPVIARYAREIIFLQPDQPRATPASVLKALLPSDFKGVVRTGEVTSIFPVAGVCTEGGEGDVLVATGSIYLIGEISQRLFTTDLPGEALLQDKI